MGGAIPILQALLSAPGVRAPERRLEWLPGRLVAAHNRGLVKRHLRALADVWLSCQIGLTSVPLLVAQPGVTQEGPWSVLRTGGALPLITGSNAFEIPNADTNPRLCFDLGFATDEPDAAGTFVDAFSVTLQSEDGAATALLLTADRTGVQWAPTNSGGLTLAPEEVKHAEIAFAGVSPQLDITMAFAVTYVLAADLAGRLLNVFFDLFDNLNAYASLAYVGNVRLETSAALPRLHSATTVGGPYAEEPQAVLDLAERSFSLSKPAANRFYRVLADRPARIVGIRVDGDRLVLQYAFPQVRLHSATAVNGPYTEEPGAVWDEVGQRFTLSAPPSNRFYRVYADGPARILRLQAVSGQLMLEYELLP